MEAQSPCADVLDVLFASPVEQLWILLVRRGPLCEAAAGDGAFWLDLVLTPGWLPAPGPHIGLKWPVCPRVDGLPALSCGSGRGTLQTWAPKRYGGLLVVMWERRAVVVPFRQAWQGCEINPPSKSNGCPAWLNGLHLGFLHSELFPWDFLQGRCDVLHTITCQACDNYIVPGLDCLQVRNFELSFLLGLSGSDCEDRSTLFWGIFWKCLLVGWGYVVFDVGNVGESCSFYVELGRFSCRIGTAVTKFLGFSKLSAKSYFESPIRVGIILS